MASSPSTVPSSSPSKNRVCPDSKPCACNITPTSWPAPSTSKNSNGSPCGTGFCRLPRIHFRLPKPLEPTSFQRYAAISRTPPLPAPFFQSPHIHENRLNNVEFPFLHHFRRPQDPCLLAACLAHLKHMHAIPIPIHQALQPPPHLGRQFFVQVRHEHALLHTRPIIQQRLRHPVPAPVVGYIVTDDVLHSVPSGASKRYGVNACPVRNAATSPSTSSFNRSRKFRRFPVPPSPAPRSSIQRLYSPKNRFIAAGVRNVPARSPCDRKSSAPTTPRFTSVNTNRSAAGCRNASTRSSASDGRP